MNISLQDKAKRVDNDVSFTSHDLLARVKTLVATGVWACFDRLAVNNRVGRLAVPASFITHLFVKKAYDLIPYPLFDEKPKMPVGGAFHVRCKWKASKPPDLPNSSSKLGESDLALPRNNILGQTLKTVTRPNFP